MNDGCRLQRQNRQAVVDGSGQRAVSGDGKAGDFAEGKVTKQRGIVNYRILRAQAFQVWKEAVCA